MTSFGYVEFHVFNSFVVSFSRYFDRTKKWNRGLGLVREYLCWCRTKYWLWVELVVSWLVEDVDRGSWIDNDIDVGFVVLQIVLGTFWSYLVDWIDVIIRGRLTLNCVGIYIVFVVVLLSFQVLEGSLELLSLLVFGKAHVGKVSFFIAFITNSIFTPSAFRAGMSFCSAAKTFSWVVVCKSALISLM